MRNHSHQESHVAQNPPCDFCKNEISIDQLIRYDLIDEHWEIDFHYCCPEHQIQHEHENL